MLNEEFYWVYSPYPKAIDGKYFFETIICSVKTAKIISIKFSSIYQIDYFVFSLLYSTCIFSTFYLIDSRRKKKKKKERNAIFQRNFQLFQVIVIFI